MSRSLSPYLLCNLMLIILYFSLSSASSFGSFTSEMKHNQVFLMFTVKISICPHFPSPSAPATFLLPVQKASCVQLPVFDSPCPCLAPGPRPPPVPPTPVALTLHCLGCLFHVAGPVGTSQSVVDLSPDISCVSCSVLDTFKTQLIFP